MSNRGENPCDARRQRSPALPRAVPIANRSTNVRAKPTGLGQPNRGGACEDGSNAARPRADVGEQESLLAERRGLGNNLAERRVESTWLGKATGRDAVNATISMCTDFLVGTLAQPGLVAT